MDRATVATLAAADQEIDHVVWAGADVVRAVDELAERAVRGFEVRELDWQQLAFAESDLRRLRALVAHRFGVAPGPPPPTGAQATENRSGVTFDGWTARAKELAARIEVAWVPIFSGRAKVRHAQAFTDEIALLADELPQLRMSLLRQGYGWYIQSALARVQARVATGTDAWRSAGQRLAEAVTRVPANPRVGRLRFAVGSATLSPPVVVTVRPGPSSPAPPAGGESPARLDRHVLPLPGCELPLFVDLDRDGGLVTDSPDTVAALIRRLLGALPAGRLSLSVFDPNGRGDAATLLCGLGAAAVGGPVRTTPAELAELLRATEEHLTAIAQQYLSGRYATLSDHHAGIGEVVEPYRLLVLFPPAGPAMARADHGPALARIRELGPRAGVYLVVVGAESTVDGLPELFAGRPIGPDTLRRLTGAVPAELDVDFPLAHGPGLTADTQLSYVRDGKDPFALRADRLAWRFTPPSVDGQVARWRW